MDENWYIMAGVIDAKLVTDLLVWAANQIEQLKLSD
jgi:hypothetical protein